MGDEKGQGTAQRHLMHTAPLQACIAASGTPTQVKFSMQSRRSCLFEPGGLRVFRASRKDYRTSRP